MIVLHAIWDKRTYGKLHIWAESSSQPTTLQKRRGKTSREKKPMQHPRSLAYEALRETVGSLAGSLLAQSAGGASLALRLPSSAKVPLPSPELILEQMSDKPGSLELAWWDVGTLALEPGAALDLLLKLPAHPSHGVAYGSALHFWMTVGQWVFELITRQCFVPAVRESRQNGVISASAVWEAVLSEDDEERLSLLARAMPPVCWSFLPPDAVKPSSLSDLVRHFLNQTTDAFVRESLAATDTINRSLQSASRRNRRTAVVSLAEQWLHALSSDDATLSASPDELAKFSSAMQNWLKQLRPVASDAPFRTCFRLDAPAEENTGQNEENIDKNEEPEQKSEQEPTWRVSFHLQANDDRSLLVPAEKVWRERSSTLTFLKRKFENPQDRLLADLGRASRLFPPIEESLKSARPQELGLTTEQAYTFLRESVPLLEQSGFGVHVPSWWKKPAARVGVKLKVKSTADAGAGSGLMGLNSIVEYSWNIAVGDTLLTMQEFENLVKLKVPLVKVRGQWVELRPDEIEAAIAFFQKRHARQKMSLGEALRIGLGDGQTDVGLPVLGFETEGWIREAIERLQQSAQLSLIEVPATFQGKLRPYQLKGVSWLAFLKQFGFGACLADDMGLGKTVMLIMLLLHERSKHHRVSQPINPTLLICPMSIVGNWQREIQRFAPSLSAMIHHGAERLSGSAFEQEARQHDVVITTYSLALRDKGHLEAIEWENIVIDEAQNIKNETAKQTQAIKSLQARHKIALTGTPVENRLSELWSIMEFLNPGYLGSGSDFRKSFAIPIERYRNAERVDTLKRLIQPFVLRRLKTDKTIIQDLPDKLEMNVLCNLTQEQASLYEAVVQEMIEKIEEADGIERKGLVLSTLMKLKQICNHPAHFMADGSSLARRSGKLARLEEMLEEVLAEGDKALIFTQFAEMGAMLRHYLQETLGCEVLFLHGGTPKKQRDMMVQRFQEERRNASSALLRPTGSAAAVPLFILSLKAGGVGLNLTAANHVFHFDRWWNPAVEDQATDRAFRIGQQKNVQVHKFVCVGTLEERINQMIEQKKALAENIVGSGEQWLTEMSTTQLKELFALSREAIGE